MDESQAVAGSLTGERMARSIGQKIRYAKVRLHARVDAQAEAALAEIRELALLARIEIEGPSYYHRLVAWGISPERRATL